MAALLVEVAAGVVVAQHPRLPDAQIGHLEVGVALAERGAKAEVALGGKAGAAVAERLLPVGMRYVRIQPHLTWLTGRRLSSCLGERRGVTE